MTHEELTKQRKRLGHTLADARFNRHLTQQDIASILGLPRTQVARIESGEYNVGWDHLIKYADYLGLPILQGSSTINQQELKLGNFVVIRLERMIDNFPGTFRVEDIIPNLGSDGAEYLNITLKRYPESTHPGEINSSIREINELRPISINTRWLEAFGFNLVGQVWDYNIDPSSFSLWNESQVEGELELFLRTPGMMRKRVEFIHELQNLFSQRRKGEVLNLLDIPQGI